MYRHDEQSMALLQQLPADSQKMVNDSEALTDWFIALAHGDTQGGYAIAYVQSMGCGVISHAELERNPHLQLHLWDRTEQ